MVIALVIIIIIITVVLLKIPATTIIIVIMSQLEKISNLEMKAKVSFEKQDLIMET